MSEQNRGQNLIEGGPAVSRAFFDVDSLCCEEFLLHNEGFYNLFFLRFPHR